jgi:hypothetical protein
MEKIRECTLGIGLGLQTKALLYSQGGDQTTGRVAVGISSFALPLSISPVVLQFLLMPCTCTFHALASVNHIDLVSGGRSNNGRNTILPAGSPQHPHGASPCGPAPLLRGWPGAAALRSTHQRFP